ncbi:MAG: TetR/AcrR family transcriptional regulator C-terminal domain-containing protein [Christensenellales bacterium]
MNTKKTLAASLKKFMERKPLSKISVSEIIRDCGVNRKTFYYHFEDIYALLKWTLEQEAIEVVKNFDLLLDLEEAIIFVTDYVDANRHILNCAYDSMGRDEMKRFFFSDFSGVIISFIERYTEKNHIDTSDEYKQFVAYFYTEALAGMLIDYFQHKENRDRDKIIKYIENILKKSIPNVL